MRFTFSTFVASLALLAAAPAAAQVQTIDPNQAPSSQPPTPSAPEPAANEWVPVQPEPNAQASTQATDADRAVAAEQAAAEAPAGQHVPRNDVFHAAEGLFGQGAEGLAGILENILRDQGEPTAYIAGREAGGAFMVGLRYGSGTMHHQVEGDRAVYWRGPSLGFDVGADANKVFVLVYNLHDSQDLYRRFPGAEGNAYFLGGFTAQYLRRGDIVLIPIRLGVGMRLGVNAGYMRFSQRNRWLPF